MKKKLTLVIVAIVLVAAIAVGGSLAYFTDTKTADNVFTVGNVSIELNEDFVQNSNLVPGSKTENAINKDVSVTNTGSNDAYVRVKIYIPSALDQLTTPQYTTEGHLVAAAFNTVHMNTYPGVDTIWNINKANVEAKAITTGEYDGYNEYTFYYNTALAAGTTTERLLDQVYMDSKVDCDYNDVTGIYTWFKMINGVKNVVDYDFENGVTIKVVAEAIQAEGFADYAAAFEAFDAQ